MENILNGSERGERDRGTAPRQQRQHFRRPCLADKSSIHRQGKRSTAPVSDCCFGSDTIRYGLPLSQKKAIELTARTEKNKTIASVSAVPGKWAEPNVCSNNSLPVLSEADFTRAYVLASGTETQRVPTHPAATGVFSLASWLERSCIQISHPHTYTTHRPHTRAHNNSKAE